VVKYSPKDTTIWISCAVNENKVTVSVRDEGIGIKSSYADKIFERYSGWKAALHGIFPDS